MNRSDYMNGTVDHHTYYLAVADAIGRDTVDRLIPATVDEVVKALSVDEHLNNIPLARWDRMHASMTSAVRRRGSAVMAVSWSGQPLPPRTICWSMGETVCVLKAAARRLAEEKATD